ncbi:MAG: FAD-dependent oxidoreductase [Clostridia bacterium]|nr:FAD-dependent oxidoreductase [Clostridia bacterium]
MILHEALETAVVDSCDVLVCGGGIAGISAALAAARLGKRVLLLEKNYLLGGLGTSGLITYYLPLCDGHGHQVSFGIAEELLRLSISQGAEDGYPANWLNNSDPAQRTEQDSRFEVRYNAQLFALLAEQHLLRAGVEILYGTYAVGVNCDDDTIQAVITESKSGRQAIAAATVVDATGDCDIAWFAGAPTAVFRQGNVLAGWYYSVGKSGYTLNVVGYADKPENQKTEADRERTRDWERFCGLSGKELSHVMQWSHELTYTDLMNKRSKDATVVPATLATIPQVRMTRKLVGTYCLDDTEMHTFFEDSIGMVSDWRKRGPIYEVPFSTLYSPTIKNLITAGRCTSVTESMWDIMRVIPCCAVTGQAAGTAAALTSDFTSLNVAILQDHLKKSGVILHEKELTP